MKSEYMINQRGARIALEEVMTVERRDHWNAAMLHMRLALELLDSAEAPALIGARLDQAIHALQKELDRSPATHLPKLRDSKES